MSCVRSFRCSHRGLLGAYQRAVSLEQLRTHAENYRFHFNRRTSRPNWAAVAPTEQGHPGMHGAPDYVEGVAETGRVGEAD